MAIYYRLLLGEELPAIHPMEAKKQLARRIVTRYHGRQRREAALEDFNKRFSKKDLASAELPEVDLQGASDDILSAVVVAFEKGFPIKKSRGDARRLVEQGSVQLRGEKIPDQKAAPKLQKGDVLRLDKTHAVRVA